MKKLLNLSMLALLTSSGSLYAAGYAVQERSIKGLGRAFSGEAAIADDASVLASNPAGLIYLADGSYSIGINGIDGHFSATGTSVLGGGPLGQDNISSLVGIPAMYYTAKINDSWSYGIGSFTQFGLGSEYDASFAGAALTEKSELVTLNINPSVAYRMNDNFSFGAGVSVVYIESKLTGRDSMGGELLLDGDDIAYGYNFGAIFDNRRGTRVGLSYRSSVAVSLEGKAQNTLFVTMPQVPLTDASADAKLPGIVELSVYHELNSKWSVHGDVQYTRWNSFQRLTSFTNGGDEVLNNAELWDNSYKVALGVTYKHSPKWTFRAGLAYDETPVTSSSYRTLRIPDSDRIWVSCGATYALNDNTELDFGYTYVKANQATINEPAGGNGVFQGEVGGFTHVFGVALSGKF